MITFLLILAVFVYILIGWFVRAMLQDEREEPSILLTMIWPLVLLLIIICKLFEILEDWAISIKEKKDGN